MNISVLERLRAENEALKKTKQKGLTLKVSEKGGLSVYGLGRFRFGRIPIAKHSSNQVSAIS